MEDSPSPRRVAEENLQKIYQEAVELALIETDLIGSAKEVDVPEDCPYNLAILLEGNLDALWSSVGRNTRGRE